MGSGMLPIGIPRSQAPAWKRGEPKKYAQNRYQRDSSGYRGSQLSELLLSKRLCVVDVIPLGHRFSPE